MTDGIYCQKDVDRLQKQVAANTETILRLASEQTKTESQLKKLAGIVATIAKLTARHCASDLDSN